VDNSDYQFSKWIIEFRGQSDAQWLFTRLSSLKATALSYVSCS